MSIRNDEGGVKPPKEKALNVRVRYLAARNPFVDNVDAQVKLNDFKPTVLQFFGLAEGAANGGTKVYNFALNGIVQTDLQSTLGGLAASKHELKLDLIEQFQQG